MHAAARHFVADERPPPSQTRRLRQRGPRSAESIAKRLTCHRRLRRQPLGSGLCKSSPVLPINLDFTILHLNIGGFASHRDELLVHLEMHSWPDIVGITGTKMDVTMSHPLLAGYVLISRLDRRNGSAHGGILLFARASIAPYIVHIADSEHYERSWHIFHSHAGPVLLCLWYRPPCYGEIASILAFEDELKLHRPSAIGTIAIGDFNVHNKAWLTHSRNTAPEGTALQTVCDSHGLRECVRQPTRGKYLLDLALTDLDHATTTTVAAGVSDHNMVLCKVALGTPRESNLLRPSFQYNKQTGQNYVST